MQVKNVPENSTPEAVKEAIEACGVTVRSVAFEPELRDGLHTAIVRFPVMPLPWNISAEELAVPLLPVPEPEAKPEVTAAAEGEQPATADAMQAEGAAAAAEPAAEAPAAEQPHAAEAEEGAAAAAADGGDDTTKQPDQEPSADHQQQQEGGEPAAAKPQTVAQQQAAQQAAQTKRPPEDGHKEGDILKMARYLVWHLIERKAKIDGELMNFDVQLLPVTLFIGNAPFDTDAELRADMEQHGEVERCFLMRSADGTSKVRRGRRERGRERGGER
jgi:hypothetical protein